MTDQVWPIDMNALAQTVGSKASKLLPDLIPIYIEDAELLVDWMTEALQKKDATKLKHAAHRLKGNSASMGVLTIVQFADELEKLGKAGDLETAVHPFTQLLEEYNKVRAALLSMIA